MAVTAIRLDTQAQDETLVGSKIKHQAGNTFHFPDDVTVDGAAITDKLKSRTGDLQVVPFANTDSSVTIMDADGVTKVAQFGTNQEATLVLGNTNAPSNGTVAVVLVGTASGGSFIEFDNNVGSIAQLTSNPDQSFSIQTNGQATPWTWLFGNDASLTTPGGIAGDTDNAYDLGLSAKNWRAVYSKALTSSTAVTVTASSGNIVLNPSGSVNVSSKTIINVADPVNAQDAATKHYVDNLAQGISWKNVVRSATTGALPAYTYNNGASGVGATITATSNGALPAQDGVTLVAQDRLLVKDETGGNAPYNGIYVVTQVGDGSHPFILTRALDEDTPTEITWATVEVGADAVSQPGYIYREDQDIVTVGTTNVHFTNISQGTSLIFSNGTQLVGNTVSIKTDTTTANTIGVQGTANGAGTKFDPNSFADSGSETLALASNVAGNGLSLSSGQLSVNVSATGGLNFSSSALQIKIDSTTDGYATISTGSNGTRVVSIKNANIASDAAIAFSKLASLTSAHILIGNGGVATDTAVSGDVTLSAAGVVTITATALGSSGHFVTREVPSGTINGSNAVFILAATPVSGSEEVFLNGILQNLGGGNDYTISGGTITFTAAPDTGSVVLVNYRK